MGAHRENLYNLIPCQNLTRWGQGRLFARLFLLTMRLALFIDQKLNFLILLLLWKVELVLSTIDLLNETHHMVGLFPLFIWLNITCYFKGYNLQLYFTSCYFLVLHEILEL